MLIFGFHSIAIAFSHYFPTSFDVSQSSIFHLFSFSDIVTFCNLIMSRWKRCKGDKTSNANNLLLSRFQIKAINKVQYALLYLLIGIFPKQRISNIDLHKTRHHPKRMRFVLQTLTISEHLFLA